MSYQIVEMYRTQLKMLEKVEAELEETHREFVASQCELMSVETEDNLKETVIRAMKNLEHSKDCQVKNCAIQGCSEMKTITEHMRRCKEQEDKSCGICKTVRFYLYKHANGCTVEGCKVVMCLNIRSKLAARKADAARTSAAAAAAKSSQSEPSTSEGSK
ncbi:hypothetical protein PRIPAC_92766 [Pristionchus pacificus]|uniref:histone acetyltransferase n=1 Tax=Pristionchus pacificus TaxID=54126 RepID=A0A2A6BAT6_PRIPA|nr:hypothetical protein PRIPAC_92766 [Pristionchus pacificus]|eukprot:PDM62951.1 hypothetical protein PRIPAC_50166 [Pristionchus pacificus]